MSKHLVIRRDVPVRRVMQALTLWKAANDLARGLGRGKLRPSVDMLSADAQRLRSYRPTYTTSAGYTTYELKRLYANRKGKLRAEYVGRWRNPGTGRMETGGWVYGIVNGLPVELRRL